MLVEPIVAAFITASVAAVTAYITYRNRHSERVKLTRDLYNQFFTIMDSRSSAWFWLEELNASKRVPSFEELWRMEDTAGKVANLYKVAGFWFLTYQLHKARQLDRQLASSLFTYELYYWCRQLSKLIEATRARDATFPQVFEALESDSWLVKKGYTPGGAK